MIYDLGVFSLILIGLGMPMLNYLDGNVTSQRTQAIRNSIGFILFVTGMALLAIGKHFLFMALIWAVIGVYCVFIKYLNCPTKEKTQEVFNNRYGVIVGMSAMMGLLCLFLDSQIN